MIFFKIGEDEKQEKRLNILKKEFPFHSLVLLKNLPDATTQRIEDSIWNIRIVLGYNKLTGELLLRSLNKQSTYSFHSNPVDYRLLTEDELFYVKENDFLQSAYDEKRNINKTPSE